MKRALMLLLFAAACGAPEPPAPFAAPRDPATLAARLPKREDLVCFPCHSQLKFEKGPPFPHAKAAHKMAGHWHVCHQGSHHEGRAIDKTACLTCHEAGSEEVSILAKSDTASN